MTKHEWHLLTGLPTEKPYVARQFPGFTGLQIYHVMGDKPGSLLHVAFENPKRFQKQNPYWHSSLLWWDEKDTLAAQFNRDFPNQTHLFLGKFQRLLDKKE